MACHARSMPLVARCAPSVLAAGRIYSGLVLDLSSLDLKEIAGALADQTDYEHRWLINPHTDDGGLAHVRRSMGWPVISAMRSKS
jgi:hypothetical protein